MSMLAALNTYYERLSVQGKAPPFGYAPVLIGFVLVLARDGTPLRLDGLGDPDAKRPGREEMVPRPPKRASNIAPCFLWDKTAYTLGVIAEKGEDGTVRAGAGRRTADEHAAFKALHEKALRGTDDDGLKALLAFLSVWRPKHFIERGLPSDALDRNIAFRLEGDNGFLHERPAARAIWARQATPEGDERQCLVLGTNAPAARLHPSIKGVMGAQSSGASLISFNEAAYESHGRSQGDNAPVSEQAAFNYGTALNAMLARGSGHSLRLGDTTTVFWAEAPRAEDAEEAELWADAALAGDGPREDDDARHSAARNRLGASLERMNSGRMDKPEDMAPAVPPDTKLHILGLAPNNARLAVRFWQSGPFGDFARNLTDHWQDLAIDPPAFKGVPAAWALLYETALGREAKNIPPLLGGHLMRAVLSGQPYPRTLLSAVIARIRADGDVSARRAAICKAVLVRNLNLQQGDLVSLDSNSDSIAYNLGRLFAAFAYAERSYADRGATIRDKYMGAASATPRRVFPILMRGYEHNRSALAKADGNKRGAGIVADKAIGQIVDLYNGDVPFPATLRLEEQARFFVGFYHQDRSFYARNEPAAGDDNEEGEQ